MMNKKYDVFNTNMLKTFFDAIILLIVGLAFFRLAFTPNTIILAFILGVVYAAAGILYFASLRIGDVSKVMPYLQSVQLLFIFLGSLLLFSEPSNILNYLGIIIILIGIYAVLSKKGFKAPKIDKLFFYVLAIVALHIVYWLLTKQALFNSQPISLAVAMYFSGSLVLGVYQLLLRKKMQAKAIKPAVAKSTIPTILVAAIFGSAGTLLLFTALSIGFASKVYPLAGLQSVFIAVIAKIFLREKWYWSRIIGTLLVCVGIFLISI
jgi:uncharacterized membrane protein